MRRLFLASTLLLAACATGPRPSPKPVPQAPAANLPTQQHQHHNLIGMTANELVQHFGSPRIQVREGDGTKFQWTADGCILDVYIYPPESGQGIARVIYADARTRSGGQMSVTSCATIIEAH